MLISSPEFNLIELDLLSDSGSGRTFKAPSSSEKRLDHPFQSRVQQVRQGVQFISDAGIYSHDCSNQKMLYILEYKN